MALGNSSLDLIIFDLDGTLVKFTCSLTEAKKCVSNLLASLGISLPFDVANKPFQDIFDEIANQARKTGSLDLDYIMAQINDIIDFYEMQAATSTTIFEEARDVLDALKENGLKIALVTNNGRKATRFVLKRFSLEKFFDIIVTRNDGLRLKPYPDGVLWVLDKVGAHKTRTLFVGDSVIDVKAGKSAGVIVAAIKGQFLRSQSDFEIKPDYLIDRLSDILSLIRRL